MTISMVKTIDASVIVRSFVTKQSGRSDEIAMPSIRNAMGLENTDAA